MAHQNTIDQMIKTFIPSVSQNWESNLLKIKGFYERNSCQWKELCSASSQKLISKLQGTWAKHIEIQP